MPTPLHKDRFTHQMGYPNIRKVNTFSEKEKKGHPH